MLSLVKVAVCEEACRLSSRGLARCGYPYSPAPIVEADSVMGPSLSALELHANLRPSWRRRTRSCWVPVSRPDAARTDSGWRGRCGVLNDQVTGSGLGVASQVAGAADGRGHTRSSSPAGWGWAVSVACGWRRRGSVGRGPGCSRRPAARTRSCPAARLAERRLHRRSRCHA